MSASNRAVQKIKIVLNDMDKKFSDRLHEIYALELENVNNIKHFKEDKEHFIIEVGKFKLAAILINKRIKVVESEYNRIRDHKAELVDTAVWMEGVLQRCVTKDLKKFLKKEIKTEKEKLAKTMEDSHEIKEKILELTTRQDKARRDCDKMSMAAKIFGKVFRDIKAKSIASLVADLNNRLEAAEKLEHKIENATKENRKNELAGANTLVQKVRLKESELRTKDERKFIGMDLILCPEAHTHLSVAEIEEMQFDSDYNCNLSKVDLLRVSKLPDQVEIIYPKITYLKPMIVILYLSSLFIYHTR